MGAAENALVDDIQRRYRFLSSASAALAESLDYQRTLQRVAELAVPDIADWCTVTVVDAHGALQRLAVVHADPAKRELSEEYQRKFPPTEHRSNQLLKVLEEDFRRIPELLGRSLEQSEVQTAAPFPPVIAPEPAVQLGLF